MKDQHHQLGVQHSMRFRKVSSRYARRVAEAYDSDIAAAQRATDEEVARRVAQYERQHGLPVTDWVAIGRAERDEDEPSQP
jgi:uncharacterized NAD-dependent epimerase/dehydratase family protein